MSDFAVKWSQLYDDSSKMKELSSSLQKQKEKLSSAKSGISYCISPGSRQGLQTRLNSILENLELESSISQGLGEKLEETVRRYLDAEQKICENAGAEFSGADSLNSGLEDDKTIWEYIQDLIKKLIGECGIVGKLIGAAWSNDTLPWLKAINSIAGSIAKSVSGASVKWSELFFGKWGKGQIIDDLQKAGYSTGSKTDIFWSSMAKKLDDFKFDKAKKVGGNISVATKWIGIGLSAVSNGFENYEEFHGDLSNERFWEETITETALDWGIGALAGAAAAALIGGAPAVVVAGAGVAAVWALNWGTEYITENIFGEKKDFTEVISDGLLNMSEWISGKADAAVRWAGDYIVGLFGNSL